MRKFISAVHAKQLAVKFHLSLHSPFDGVRHKIMPSASPVRVSVDLLKHFKERTRNAGEIHYALIAGVNDREEDVVKLIRLFKGSAISIKFLAYNEKPNGTFHPSERVARIRKALEDEGIQTEYYNPPGSDIGSSCGQFLMHYYTKYNTKPPVRRR
jgi:23S rRNA (adenine2503-C2)-methyltransferase